MIINQLFLKILFNFRFQHSQILKQENEISCT
jgi:hypothetical protein